MVKDLPASAGDAGVVGSIPGLGKIPWRRKWQLTPVFLPGKFHEQRILESYSPWGHKRVRPDFVTKTVTATTNLFFESVWIHGLFYSDELTTGLHS